MDEETDFRPVAWLVIVLGISLSFAVAVVPFYQAGHLLRLDVLLVGLLPYIVLGTFSGIVRGWALLVASALALGIDVIVKIPERYWHYDGYAGGAVFWAPLALAIVVLPVVLVIGGRSERARRADNDSRAAASASD
jgi:hypothetical protein